MPQTSALTERDRAGLSPEELEALEGDVEGDDGVEDADDDADKGEGDDKADKPDAKADKDDKKGDADADTAQPDAAAPARSTDLPALAVPAAQDWDALEAGVVKKYEDGELSEVEYRKELRALHVAEATTQVTASMSEQFAETQWKREAEEFNGAHAEYTTSRSRHAALNAAMEAVEKETKGTLSGRALLDRAHKLVVDDLGEFKKPDAKPSSSARPRPKEADARKSANDKVPVNLGDLPAADNPADIGSDKWAVLDRLAETDGMAFERELAKLTDSEQKAYLEAA